MRLRVLVSLACAAAVAGCGAEQQQAPELDRPQRPAGSATLRFPAAGMTFAAPANWRLRERESPAVFTLASGTAQVNGFAYRRSEPLPARGPALEAARERLVAEVRERDPRFRLTRARTASVDGAPAIELRGEQVIARQRYRTRSVHVFRGSAEYVLEALAEPRHFRLVDRGVLAPLLDSLEVTGRVRRAR